MKVLLPAIAAILLGSVLVGCGSPAPTPTPTPTATPIPPTPTLTATQTPTPEPGFSLETIKETLASVPADRLQELAGELTDEIGSYICQVVAGDFEPTLSLEDLTEDRFKQLAIRTYCTLR